MDLPCYFIVGERPVKFVRTPEGGMEVLAFDWGTGEFVREMSYLSRCLLGKGEIDVVSEAEFEARAAELRARLRR
ncbi:MAG: hypothetical protein QM765_36910 [Myxococcales bacterium]